MKKMKNYAQQYAIEILDPHEEATLEYIKTEWNKNRKHINIKDIHENFIRKSFGFTSFEKSRQVIFKLYRKGQILMESKGKEKLIRPNHVTVNSKYAPDDFRTITLRDEKTDFPTSRLWFSMFKHGGSPFLNISESKYLNNSWETANNIVIPPECVDEFLEILEVMKSQLKNYKKRGGTQ